MKRGVEQTVSSHVNTQPTFDIYAGVQDRDLGGVESDIDRIVADQQKQLEAPDHISVRGQIQSKNPPSCISASAWSWRSSRSIC